MLVQTALLLLSASALPSPTDLAQAELAAGDEACRLQAGMCSIVYRGSERKSVAAALIASVHDWRCELEQDGKSAKCLYMQDRLSGIRVRCSVRLLRNQADPSDAAWLMDVERVPDDEHAAPLRRRSPSCAPAPATMVIPDVR